MIHISATNRGSTRIESDFYATPIPVVENFLKHHKLQKGLILEPCAGNGNIIKAIRQRYYDNYITAIELRDEEKLNLKNSGANEVGICNFLTYNPEQEYKTIITNPPFSVAQQVIEHCFDIVSEGTEIIMLLRLAFLESKKRYDFWQKYPISKLYVLSERPSFTGHGTDATAYAWFVWDNSNQQKISVI